MEIISHLLLSDYQRAILCEMGISSWQLVDDEKTQIKDENLTDEVVTTLSEITSKEDALTKLKQLKTHTIKSTDSVLVTFSQNDSKLQIFSDVLISLGLEAHQPKYISIDQLAHYSDYPLSWTQGEKVSLNNKQLITPTLVELQHSDTKKQLWQQLQNALPIAKI
jgi:DNA polymerase III psi subunit